MTTDNNEPGRTWRHPFRRLMGLFGIRYPQEKGKWVLLTRRFRLISLGAVVLLLAALLSFTFYFSSRPEFCASCHFIRPYVESWRTSSHKDVACAECHFPPGWRGTIQAKTSGLIELMKTITGDYGTVPRAEIEDSACLREGCHETRLLEGEVLFKDKYKFDHKPHLTKLRRGKTLRCTSCHSQIVQGAHITVTESVCFTCHFKGRVHDRVLDPIAGCTACHAPPAEPIKTARGATFKHQPFLDREVPCWKCHFDAVQGTGDVPRQVCQTCHGDQDKLAKFADSKLIHDQHVTKRKVECFQCHSEIRHGLRPQAQETENHCAVCHGGGHSAHADMFAGRGGKGVKDSPGKHFLANVDCVACHEVPSFEHGKELVDQPSRKATEEVCIKCHGASRKGTLAEWDETLGEMLQEAKAQLAKAQAACAALPEGTPSAVKAGELIEVARHNCQFVERASGVHNLDYALDLLDAASDSAAKALRLAKDAREAPASSDRATTTSGNGP